jgi:hypothetical protein
VCTVTMCRAIGVYSNCVGQSVFTVTMCRAIGVYGNCVEGDRCVQ